MTDSAAGTSPRCPRHPQRTAAYRCDGCGELLCEGDVEHGHRLIFCRLCGERALPLGGGTADGEPGSGAAQRSESFLDRRRAAVAASAEDYGWAEALTYPFRGPGAYLFWGFVMILVVLDLLAASLPPGAGMATWVPNLLIALLVPAFLLKIANSTARGDDELPDWPDFDVWNLVRSFLLYAVATLFCLLPTFLVLWLLGGATVDFPIVKGSNLLILGVGLVVALVLWIPTFGSTALYDTFGAFFRLDMHLQALAVDPRGVLATTAALSAALLGQGALLMLLVAVPLIGSVAATVIQTYALFLAPHLVGLYFRRNWTELEEIYLG